MEKGFRIIERFALAVELFRHQREERIRANVFFCMLAGYGRWLMEKALAPLLLADHDPHAAQTSRESIEAPALRLQPSWDTELKIVGGDFGAAVVRQGTVRPVTTSPALPIRDPQRPSPPGLPWSGRGSSHPVAPGPSVGHPCREMQRPRPLWSSRFAG